MLLKEYMETNNIWSAIDNICQFGFLDYETPTNMNDLLEYRYGERTMFKTLNVDILASVIITEYREKWLRIESLVQENLSISARETRTVIEDTTSTEDKTSAREDVNKVSAFNSDVLIVNDGQNSSGTEGSDLTKNTAGSVEIRGIQDAYKNLTLLEKNAIIQTVTNDVANFVTLSIY